MSISRNPESDNPGLAAILEEMLLPLTTQPYVYSSLPSAKHIRILYINPGLRGTPIHCSLHAVPLDEPTSYPAPSNAADPFSGYKGMYEIQDIKYTALSYTWGDRSLTHTLFCDSSRGLKITSNLHAALQRLRLENEHRLVWADAVCIDQSNLKERGEQVKLMRHIYTSATETIVFLGEDAEDARKAMALAKKLFDRVGDLSEDSGSRQVHDLPNFAGEEWVGLGVLFALPWFRRIWTIQEFAVSPNLSFLWAEFTFDFLFLRLLTQAISSLGLTLSVVKAIQARYGQSLEFSSRLLGKVSWMEALWERIRQSDYPPITALLQRSVIKESTDPRDQVYAVVGISDRRDDPNFYPDYSLTLHHTFARVFKYLLGDGIEGPSLLHLVGLPRSRPELPSWMPDLATVKSSHQIQNITTPFTAGGPIDSDAQLEGNMTYSAAGWELIDDLKILVAQAAVVDVVEKCLDTALESGTFSELGFEYFSESFQLTLHSRAGTSKFEHIRRHANTLFFGQEPEDMSEVIWTYSQLTGVVDGNHANRLGRNIIRAVSQAVGFQYCLTQRGTTGHISCEGRSGDKICIFPGMRTPFLIRDLENGFFSLIGECFIDGLMYHEEVQRNAVVKFERIRLV